MTDLDAPIGVFDSGVGGLTVARAIADQLPREPLQRGPVARLARRFLAPSLAAPTLTGRVRCR